MDAGSLRRRHASLCLSSPSGIALFQDLHLTVLPWTLMGGVNKEMEVDMILSASLYYFPGKHFSISLCIYIYIHIYIYIYIYIHTLPSSYFTVTPLVSSL